LATKKSVEPRASIRMIAPGPVTLISTSYHDQPNVMTAGWLQPLSLDPTMIGAAVQPSRLTHEFMTKSETFVINIPNVDLISAVHLCGMVSGREKDKWAAAKLEPAEASVVEAPLVAECVGHIECEVVDRVSFGDHDLFIGRVVAASADDEAFKVIWDVTTEAGQLLNHLGGDCYAGLSKPYQAKLPTEE
jgi:flavin reductase (DIM6/NTAB) family NADH-FMN oxidoreductase RutF